jgi:RNA polymerase sigma-70 factor, ECF subfamily
MRPSDQPRRDEGEVLSEGVEDREGGHAPTLDFRGFYREEVERTLAMVIALRGPRAAAEDAVQEAFARAYGRWDEVSAMERPDLWVQRVALNLATSQLRRLAAEARAVLRLGRSDAARPLTHGYDDAEGFWRLVRRLPAQQARVVALHYAADRSVAEVAEVLGIADGTVKAHLHAARRRLAALLDREDDDA